jgi:hypothetical protein
MRLFNKKENNEFVPLLSFHDSEGNSTVSEHIPKDTGKFEYYVRDKWLKVIRFFGVQGYYWQYRHFLYGDLRKKYDLMFMKHVWEAHEGDPDDWFERQHYRSAWSLYGQEFRKAIIPKISLEKENTAVTHEYLRAYYKRWLIKDDPNMREFYHGVNWVEIYDLLTKLQDNMNKDFTKNVRRQQYHDRKLKKSKSKK